ncbi:cystathionine gamma-synthase [Diplodia corticola]|uniref:Cystathionine gamma-synthase n=1 Tax=Diplodia corticola TaxID=236234 RepID=A0A1J9R7Z9_9PEZI|nr:cystathionine gamma-synthase [Diplodia corticola]OJD36720.1 cystathionine gamma-synthase [Diplodia corticola]
MTPPTTYDPATLAIHGDDWLNKGTDVAPAMHVSTTFRYKHDPAELRPATELETDGPPPSTDIPPVYSRLSAPNTTRLEALLSELTGGRALTYTSGLSAFHALMVYLRPNVVAIGHDGLGGYHGCHGVLALHTKMHGLRTADLHDEATWDAAGLGEGDVVHVETPLNPTGAAYDIAAFAAKAHARGAFLSIDSTFGPPGLQDPLALGADVVMHSGTKYVGGHSDMLCGVLVVPERREDWFWGLWNERVFLGSVMGSLEGWLGVRSLRTLQLRVQAQSRNAERLVRWLHENLVSDDARSPVAAVASKVVHASLQAEDLADGWLKRQMPNGFGPVFAVWMRGEEEARKLPSKLKLFHHATSLGGVESLVEWRRMSDKSVDPTLLRFSIGIESWEDLRDDLEAGFKALAEEKAKA